MWKLNSKLLNNQYLNNKNITRENRKYLQINEDKETTQQSMTFSYNSADRKIYICNCYAKTDVSQVANLTSQLEKKEE